MIQEVRFLDDNQQVSVAILIQRISRYFSVWESAQLLGGKRIDRQDLDEIGWWVRCLALEFSVPTQQYEKFEREMREVYEDEITISICRYERAALPL